MTDLLIICQIIPLVLLMFKIAFDYKKWLEKKKVNHALEWIIVASLTLITDWLLLELPYFIIEKPMIASLLLSAAIGAPFFNGGYNLMRDLPVTYIGDDASYSSWSDRFYHKLNRLILKKDGPISPFPLIFETIFLIGVIYYCIIIVK